MARDEQSTLTLAQSYMQTRDRLTEAIALLAPLAKAHPEDSDVSVLLGKAMILSGRLPEASELLENVAKQSYNAEAFLLAGQSRFAMSQFELARNDGDAASRLSPGLAGLKTLRGMVYEQTADYERAEELLLKAVSEDPNDFSAHLYLGANFYFKRKLPQAKSHLQRALELQPGSSQARYELALVQRADGSDIEALANLESVVRQMPDWLQPHVELSALYYHLHRPEDGAREKETVDRMMAALQQIQSHAAQ